MENILADNMCFSNYDVRHLAFSLVNHEGQNIEKSWSKV
jgi:hypothetical protein